MGVFGSSKKTYVSTSVSRLVPDEHIPDQAKSSMITAIMSNKNIADTMLESSLDSKVFGFERMYRYGKSGQYFYGLPNGREVSDQEMVPLIQDVLRATIDPGVTVDYAKLDEALPKHYGYQTLFDDYGFDRISGELTTLSTEKGTPVYLKNMVSYVPVTSESDVDLSTLQLERDILPEEYGDRTDAQQNQALYESLKDIERTDTNNDFVYDFSIDAQLRVEVFYMWDVGGVTQQDSFTVILPDSIDADPKTFYQVGYFIGSSQYGYWTYEYGAGLHTELDTFFDVKYNQVGTYFPFAIFRRNFINRTANGLEETEEFKSTKRLLDYIDVDFKELGNNIHESPDITDVAQSVLMMAVPLNTQNQIEARYLHDYFDRMQTTTTKATFLLNDDNALINRYTITWSDADYSLSLSYHDVYKHTMVEKFGEVGDCKVSSTEHSHTYSVEVRDRDGTTTETRTANYTKYHVKKQLAAGMTRVITVVNPVAKYDIDYKRSYESTQDNDILLIPLDFEITKAYKLRDKEILYNRSMHLVFNAKVVIKLKWYETSIFKAFILIVAVVITVWTGIDVITSIYGFLATLGLSGVVLVLATVLVFAGLQMAISYGFKLVVKELGTEVAMIIAVALMAYGGYKGFSGQMPTAQTYMALGTNMMDASTYMLEQDMKAITQEGVDLAALKTEQEAELEKAMELLDQNEFLDPFLFIGKKPIIIPGETPNSFYLRTIHQGNPARLFYKSIENYAEIMLTIPKGN